MGRIVLALFTWMAIQFYCFISSFYAPGQGRWLPFAYISLAVIILLLGLGYISEGVVISGDKLYPQYGPGVAVIAVALMTLASRSTYIFWKRLRILNNLELRNQIVSLLLSLFVLIVFSFTALLPWGKEFPLSHFGAIIIAFILSYAVVRHQLVDIRIVLRRGLGVMSLGIIGAASYGLLFFIFHTLLRFDMDLTATLVAPAIAIVVAIFVFKLRGYLFTTMGKAFQGQSYDYRHKLADFADKIHNVFSLQEQGGELLTLVTKAVGSKRARLLFLEAGSEDFAVRFVEPDRKDSPSSNLRFSGQSLIVEYLKRERKLLTRENLEIMPEFRGLWEQEKEEIKAHDIEMFMPLISRDRLIGILVMDKKQSGRYSLEDLKLLEDINNRVAVSLEKEYLRERLREREEELSVINRSSAVITSSLDIQEIYDGFVEELKKIIDVNWAAVVLIEENKLYFLAVFSEVSLPWKARQRIPIKGTATEWVANNRKSMVEPDLSQESKFVTGHQYLKQGIRSLAYLPLIAQGEVIGSLIVGSQHPNAYNQRQIRLLEQLASQIAMSVENSRLYAEAEEKARIDELTELLNRRSLDELITSEISRHSRYGGVLSLIILDLDSFKAYNDNYGHPAGDKLLKRIGSILKSSIRNTDQAFRYGGDEFAILLPNTPIDATNQVAERIRNRIASELESGSIQITASLGLAGWPADGLGPTEVIAAADAALYTAKRSGGNQSRYTSETLLPFDEIMVNPENNNQDDETTNAIYNLATIVDAKDHYTSSHSKKASEYTVALAEALNLESGRTSKMAVCALLHDIGKIGIDGRILNKRGKLTIEEREVIKTHPRVGANIASHAQQLTHCVPSILYHHERYDGNGYPEGLKGEEIPLEARILAIADAFAAMTSKRSYSDALPLDEALEEIKRNAGKQFDPYLVEVFLSVVATTSIMREYKKVKLPEAGSA